MLIKVKAFPAAKEEKIIAKRRGNFAIYVREKPIKGMANQRIKAVLAAYFHKPESAIRLVKGWQERNKIFEINESD